MIKKAIQKIRNSSIVKRVYKRLFWFVGYLPLDKKLVVFESFLGKQFSDNPRAIYEYMCENYPEYKLYWSVDKRYEKNFKGYDLNTINRLSIKWLFVLPRAKFWISNSRLPIWIPKPKHTTYVQTWHGTPLKKLGVDIEEVFMPGTNTVNYKKNFTAEAKKWDYLISPNFYSTKIFRRAFEYEGKIIESGYPRNDFLYQANLNVEKNKYKKKMHLPNDKKVILYAPTWRDNQYYEKGKYSFTINMDLKKMRDEFGEDYIIIVRMHYLVAEHLDLEAFKGFVFDFSNYNDIRELYLISDILITDYSSVFFDYANLNRPIIFYVYDLEEYRDTLRGFYLDFEKKAPGQLVKNTPELINEIKNIEDNKFKPSEKLKHFREEFCSLESGESTKKVVEILVGNKK